MNPDPLAAFRKKPIAAPPVTPPDNIEEYEAFKIKETANRLRIRSLKAPVNAPGYNILLNVVYDGSKSTHFVLVYSIMMVSVTGKNLQKVIHAIENDKADYIQEFDAARWQKPSDASAAIIESIEIEYTEENSKTTGGEH